MVGSELDNERVIDTPKVREKNQRMRAEKRKKRSGHQDRKQEALEPGGAPLKGERAVL